jgi:hypothetical protein
MLLHVAAKLCILLAAIIRITARHKTSGLLRERRAKVDE